ncbi:MAG TPA: dTMP kinase [Candidatus Saccharimonadales bacterium]|jgi:dTMP kinase
MSNIGRYIVLEGPEGVGKSTQVTELSRRLQLAGLPVRVLREPDSQSDLTARAIRQLTQDPRYPMNTRTEVLLYNAARAQSLQIIKHSVEQGVICIVDRNYLTTLAIQYYGRGDVPDYTTINTIINFAVGGVEPDLCIVLDAPADVLTKRAHDRGGGERFDKLDAAFLERVRAGYLWEAKQRQLPVVAADGSADDVAEVIWRLVSNTLAKRGESQALTEATTETVNLTGDVPEMPDAAGENRNVPDRSPDEAVLLVDAEAQDDTAESDEPYVIQTKQGGFQITARGKEYLSDAVTTSEGNVYAFTDKLGPLTIAAAMARLSRRGDDMRVTILDEFADQMGKDEKLLHRVITAYGDDSVQQLAGLHFVIENTTKLMTNKIEWGRLASYLEQSTRYIYFDQKDKNGHYRYYVPKALKKKVRQDYIMHMDAIFDLYSNMVRRLTEYVREHSDVPQAERDVAWKGATRAQACDAARLVLPTATTTTIGVYASGQALESMIMHLMSDDMPEAKAIGKDLLEQARKVMPVLLERADKPERGGATIAYRSNTSNAVAALSRKYTSESHTASGNEPVTLVDYWPRNELNIVADMLYEHMDKPLTELRSEVDGWPYDRRMEVFNAYMGERLNRRHKPGRALEKIHYSWDLVCDFGIFCDLQRHRMVDDQQWQPMTPRLGYDTPKLIEDAGLEDEYEECFAISLKLYSIMQQAGHDLEAQYATLLGHKMRWKVTYNAREAFHLHELRTSPQGHPGYRKLVLQMHQKVADVHPLIANAMKFVNQGEDEALTRLAAERYTQFKLNQLR